MPDYLITDNLTKAPLYIAGTIIAILLIAAFLPAYLKRFRKTEFSKNINPAGIRSAKMRRRLRNMSNNNSIRLNKLLSFIGFPVLIWLVVCTVIVIAGQIYFSSEIVVIGSDLQAKRLVVFSFSKEYPDLKAGRKYIINQSDIEIAFWTDSTDAQDKITAADLEFIAPHHIIEVNKLPEVYYPTDYISGFHRETHIHPSIAPASRLPVIMEDANIHSEIEIPERIH